MSHAKPCECWDCLPDSERARLMRGWLAEIDKAEPVPEDVDKWLQAFAEASE